MQECGLPTMSTETRGSSLYSRMPFNGPSAAAFIAALISSFVTSRSRISVRSVIEPDGIGTRSAIPPSRPSSSGRASEAAWAAPVVVGTIDSAAARARRGSLCGPSWMFWSPV
jgi:hypothetical protein